MPNGKYFALFATRQLYVLKEYFEERKCNKQYLFLHICFDVRVMIGVRIK